MHSIRLNFSQATRFEKFRTLHILARLHDDVAIPKFPNQFSRDFVRDSVDLSPDRRPTEPVRDVGTEQSFRRALNLEWGYTAIDGPAHWPEHFPTASGSIQSPIDLSLATSVHDPSLSGEPLSWSYVPEDLARAFNNGRHLHVIASRKRSLLAGGPLRGLYRLEQLHFHWGDVKDYDHGSEHTLDGRAFPAEAHLVHYNAAYGEFAHAVVKSDGVCVLASFIQDGDENEAARPLFDLLLRKCRFKGDVMDLTSLGGFDATSLIPSSLDYFTYSGSLTTPPCFESVKWIVFVEPVTFSRAQLDILKNLHADRDEHGQLISNNYRPICPLNDRLLVRSFGE